MHGWLTWPCGSRWAHCGGWLHRPSDLLEYLPTIHYRFGVSEGNQPERVINGTIRWMPTRGCMSPATSELAPSGQCKLQNSIKVIWTVSLLVLKALIFFGKSLTTNKNREEKHISLSPKAKDGWKINCLAVILKHNEGLSNKQRQPCLHKNCSFPVLESRM